MASELKTD